MESYLSVPPIQAKWNQKRKAESQTRGEQKCAKKARKSEGDAGKDDDKDMELEECEATDGKPKRSQKGYQTEYKKFIDDNFKGKFDKFDAFVKASAFYGKMTSNQVGRLRVLKLRFRNQFPVKATLRLRQAEAELHNIVFFGYYENSKNCF